MKKKFYFSTLLLFVSILVSAQNFYVNPSAPNANDNNAGTDPNAPWLSLNSTKWIDGAVINLSAGTHVVLQNAVLESINVTLQGTVKTDVIIEGLSQDDIDRGGISPRFFTLHGTSILTIKNITIQNFRTDLMDMWGGMFYVDNSAVLNLENVDVKNAILPNNGGGAISSNGTLHCKNVLFENNHSPQGGAIHIGSTAVASFENTIFRNNTNMDGLTHSWKFGGALAINAYGGANANVSFDKCLFEGNISKDDGTGASDMLGGAIAYRFWAGSNFTLKITNSTFKANKSKSLGGAIAMMKIDQMTTDANANIDIRNTNFIHNETESEHASVFVLTGANDAGVKGTISFVNNTFFGNNTEDNVDRSSMFFNNIGVDLSFINNISLDRVLKTDNTPSGWGIVVNTTDQPLFKSVRFVGNVLDGFGGWMTSDVVAEIESSSNFHAANDAVNLIEATDSKGYPYMKINNNSSVAIDRGVDQFLVNGTNVVPTTDFLGVAKTGTTRDAGAVEYNSLSTNEDKFFNNMVVAYPNPFTTSLLVKSEIKSVKLFNSVGAEVLSDNKQVINTSQLQKGIYILKLTTSSGEVFVQKVQKK